MGVTARIVETHGCDLPSGLFGLKDILNISRSVHEHLKQGSEGVWRLGLHRVRLGRAVFALLWGGITIRRTQKILITTKALSEADLVALGCTSLRIHMSSRRMMNIFPCPNSQHRLSE
jgi:hypothetical protein